MEDEQLLNEQNQADIPEPDSKKQEIIIQGRKEDNKSFSNLAQDKKASQVELVQKDPAKPEPDQNAECKTKLMLFWGKTFEIPKFSLTKPINSIVNHKILL